MGEKLSKSKLKMTPELPVITSATETIKTVPSRSCIFEPQNEFDKVSDCFSISSTTCLLDETKRKIKK